MARIFKLLCPIDRIKIERVCRRWNFIARSFAWNTMTNLTIDIIAHPVTAGYSVGLLPSNRYKSINNNVIFLIK